MTSADAVSHPAPPEHPERPGSPPAAPGSQPQPPWLPWTAPAALVAGFAGAFLGAIIIGVVAAVFGASFSHPPASVTIAAVVVQDACLIAAALFFARISAPLVRPLPRDFGLVRPARVARAAALVVAGYVSFILVSYAWLSLIGQTNAEDTITEDLGAGNGTAALIGVTFVVTVAAPLAEEFFFRGYFFAALRRLGTWPAVALTGLAFGLVHVFGSPIAFLLPLAFLGGLLCVLRVQTGSLYPCIALHCINNSIALSSSQHWSWQVPVVLIAAPAAIAALLWLALRVWPAPRRPLERPTHSMV